MSDKSPPKSPDTPNSPTESRTIPQQCPPAWASDSAPTTAPYSTSFEAAGSAERYELLAEIARGGMGVVYRARDRVLDREVGVKTLLQVPREGSVVVSRFRSEAYITSQLQHPNIPPVHDLGTLTDGRPFLAMKLIKGQTLDAMIRESPTREPGLYLAIFEQVAHGVAYAHAHKVIHRDLKPLNVMVGAFSEVQVMDWGLAKKLTDEPAEPTDPVEPEPQPATEIRTTRDESDETRPGSVFGTPAYMSREQAIGAVDQIDERSDVFSLGGILCVILTGKPPYGGKDSETTRQLAAVAELGDCFARLDACGAEPDLIELCKWCLAAHRSDRPQDAGEVARAVAELRAAWELRARQAELDRVRAEGERAKAEVQVAEQRKRRKVQLALFGALVLLAAGIAGFAWWRGEQANERKLADERAAAERERAEVERMRLQGDRKAAEARAEAERGFKMQQAQQGVNANLKFASDLRTQYKFKDAAAALALTTELAKSGAPELLATVEQAQRDLAFVVQLDDIRYRKWLWIPEPGGMGDFNTKVAPPEYRKAFAERGLPLDTLDTTEAAERVSASAVKADLVAAVDDWALYEPDDSLRNRLLEIARKADKGTWTDRLRDPTAWKDKAVIEKLAADADLATVSPPSVSLLAELMWRNKLDAGPLLSVARTKHPTDFELAFTLGQWYAANGKVEQSVGPYEAARALRPENLAVWNNLSVVLRDKGDVDGAMAACKEVIKLNPKEVQGHSNLGVLQRDKGDLDGSIASFREAIRLDPKCLPAHYNLGVALFDKRDTKGSIAEFKEALKIDPKCVQAHHNLGVALRDKGDLDGAIESYKNAIKLDGTIALAHCNLGIALKEKGDVDAAIDAYRASIRLNPSFATAHVNLGVALKDKGDTEGAVAAYLEAIKHDPKDARAYHNLGMIHFDQKNYPEAIARAREAIRANPRYADAHGLLGLALQHTGDIRAARVALTEATRLDRKWALKLLKLPRIEVAPPPREAKMP
jgi:tetratricopeptide (TPR) repeat protein